MALQPTATVPVRVVDSARGQEVVIEGRIDVRSAADLRLALHAAVDDGVGDLFLHLGDVEIGDATGLGVLLESHRRARREGRRLVLASITPRTARLLRAARLHRVFHLDVAADGPATVAPLTA
ncbi:MAG TPA: STAS domain-containing protein [Lapillicoccus sp.]|jgi:anti-anti-sigma factor|nr:STAS domain-containing protein [Lapillicoccus sp.]